MVQVWVSGDGGEWSCGPSTHYRIPTPVFDRSMAIGRLNTKEDLQEVAEQAAKDEASGVLQETYPAWSGDAYSDVYVSFDGNWAGLPPVLYNIPDDVFQFLVLDGKSSYSTIGGLTSPQKLEALIAATRQEMAACDEEEAGGGEKGDCSLCGKPRILSSDAVCRTCRNICVGAAAVSRALTELKECGHRCTTSSLKAGCCSCLDLRPLRAGNTYPNYIDGQGWADNAGRNEGYCPFCRLTPQSCMDAAATGLSALAAEASLPLSSAAFADHIDASDDVLPLREDFLYPCAPADSGRSKAIYLCGNSLGLQPAGCRASVLTQLDKWASEGVEGHFTEPTPWLTIDETVRDSMAALVGARPAEVVLMNSLTANLHFMMSAFFRPTSQRFKILIEGKAFPSDIHAVTSQLLLHGLDPVEALLQVYPREGEVLLASDDIKACLQQHGQSIALVLLSGVQYYSGQLFDMKSVTKWSHEQGCVVGFDLAHAVGNVPLELHDWGCDFACWCSYKYLNCGPGSIGGCFVHQRHGAGGRIQPEARPADQQADGQCLPRLAGWWGHRLEDRFVMDPQFVACAGVDGFRVSNPPVLLVACVRASLDMFEKVGFLLRALGDPFFGLGGSLFSVLLTD